MHDGLGPDPARREGVLPDEVARRLGIALARPLHLLVPGSAPQFIDAVLDEAAAAAVSERWLERHDDGGDGPTLHQVELDECGTFVDPLTGAREPPERTYAVDGRTALEAFADAWLPVPYLRLGDDGLVAAGDPVGPSNWARVFIHREPVQGRETRFRVVLALDTALEPPAADGARGPTAPTPDDIAAGTTFALASRVDDVAGFVVEPWIDEWLIEQFAEWRRRVAADTPERETTGEGRLEHLSHYLTLLVVLDTAGRLPHVRFRAAGAGNRQPDIGGVGLVLDIGATRTTALLSADGLDGRQALRHLPVRDLSQPWRVSEGLMPSTVRFAPATFGREVYSRWSGRTSAFHWPSLARVGGEAVRLAGEQDATDALTGLSSALRYVWDDAPSRHLWRFAGKPASHGRRLPIVAGPILAHLDETGAVLDPERPRPPATRPRFSRASLLTFAVAELLLQAVSAVHAPGFALGPHPGVSTPVLTRIVVTAPTPMQEAERERFRGRIVDAVTLVWRAMGWEESGGPAGHGPPEVCLAGDATLLGQIAFLVDAIEHKLHGRARQYFDVVGKPRTETGSARVLRIATLDVGGASTSLAITGFDAGSSALTATPLVLEAFRIGGEDVSRRLIERLLMPALERRLAEAKLADARLFLKELFGAVPHGRTSRLGDFKRRFVGEIASPVARALLAEHEVLEASMDDRPAERTVRELLGLRLGDSIAAADAFDALAAEEGAELFQLLETVVTFTAGEVTRIATAVLEPVLRHALRAIRGYDCDMVLVAGGLGRLSVVREALLAGMPARPDRIVAMHEHRMGSWYPGLTPAGTIEDAKSLPAVGAALVDNPELVVGGLPVVLEDIDPASRRFLVGRTDGDGRLLDADVVFDSARYASATASGRRLQATMTVSPPIVLGMRRVPIESWPALPLFVLELADLAADARPRLPIKVTIEWTADLAAAPPRVVRATDADGSELSPAEIGIRLDSSGRIGGHWLDTGELLIA